MPGPAPTNRYPRVRIRSSTDTCASALRVRPTRASVRNAVPSRRLPNGAGGDADTRPCLDIGEGRPAGPGRGKGFLTLGARWAHLRENVLRHSPVARRSCRPVAGGNARQVPPRSSTRPAAATPAPSTTSPSKPSSPRSPPPGASSTNPAPQPPSPRSRQNEHHPITADDAEQPAWRGFPQPPHPHRQRRPRPQRKRAGKSMPARRTYPSPAPGPGPDIPTLLTPTGQLPHPT